MLTVGTHKSFSTSPPSVRRSIPCSPSTTTTAATPGSPTPRHASRQVAEQMATTIPEPVMGAEGFQDLSVLDLPQEARDDLAGVSRAETVLDHRVTVNLDWW